MEGVYKIQMIRKYALPPTKLTNNCINNVQIRVAVKREAAVTKEMNTKLADDKKISRKEKDERILWKKNEVILHKPWNIQGPF